MRSPESAPLFLIPPVLPLIEQYATLSYNPRIYYQVRPVRNLTLKSIIILGVVLFIACSDNTRQGTMRTTGQGEYETIELTSRWLWDPELPDLKEWQVLDLPRGIVITPFQDLIIAEMESARLIRVSFEGELIEVIGRAGNGPGEFVEPSDLSLLPGSDTLWVADEMAGLVSRFKIGERSSIFIDRFQAPQMIGKHMTNVQVYNSHAVLSYDFEAGTRMSLVDDQGNTVRNLGALFVLDQYPEMYQRMYNVGRIETDNTGHIYYIGYNHPIIESYGPDMELISVTEMLFPEIVKSIERKPSPGAISVYVFGAVIDNESKVLYINVSGDSRTSSVIYELDASSLQVLRRFRFQRMEGPPPADMAVFSSGDRITFFITGWLTGIEVVSNTPLN